MASSFSTHGTLTHTFEDDINSPEYEGRFHPQFNDKEADIIISSLDGTLFRIPRFTLRMTSGYFSSILSSTISSTSKSKEAQSHQLDPSKSLTHIQNNGIIPTSYPTAPLLRVLQMISGLEIPPFQSFAELLPTLPILEQWDTPGPLSFIRACCTNYIFVREPVRLYGLGWRFGWDEVVRYASTLTLNLNLLSTDMDTQNDAEDQKGTGTDSSLQEQLYELPSRALYTLLRFHRSRRDAFRDFVHSSETFEAGNSPHTYCPGCGEKWDTSSWRELKDRMIWEMDRCPSGETMLASISGGFSPIENETGEWEESRRCWDSRCKKESCGRIYYNRETTIKYIKKCLHQLPKEIVL